MTSAVRRQYEGSAPPDRRLPKEDDVRRELIFATLVMALNSSAAAIDAPIGAGVETSRRNLAGESEVRKRYEEFTAAFNRHDTNAMSAMYAPQGDHYEPDGSFAEGRAAVAAMFAAEHATGFKDATIALKINAVWMITPNVALVNGIYAVTNVQDGQGNAIAIRKGHLTSVMLLENGQWWVAASRATIPVPLPWRKSPQP